MGAVCICLTAALLFQHAYALCRNQYLNATTTSQLFSYQSYSNNEYCDIQIAPSNFLNSSQFFLEIIWTTFDIKGKLPDCKEDYVEVNLTRSGYSIGKFCSNNTLEKLFNMYSHDGFANLTFKSNNETTGDGFSFKYRLRNKTADPLVGNSSSCSLQENINSVATTLKGNKRRGN
ncbi:uncharacterized protein LOC135683532 [Rhopilema esculentum]|uniref:uncharacterized protein LOC135683532 n=1 Tax=Rhopilema esculentum TaxID=499914 RepID=UPI0031DB2FB1